MKLCKNCVFFREELREPYGVPVRKSEPKCAARPPTQILDFIYGKEPELPTAFAFRMTTCGINEAKYYREN